MNLPKSFTKVLEKYQIKKDDVVFAAIGDLDEEFRFSDTITALTKTQLILAKYPYVPKREFRFGGYDSFAGVENGLAGEPAVLFFDLEKLEKLEVIRQVSTGVLMGVIEGTEQYLCQFSNTKMETFMRLCKLLVKQKKDLACLLEINYIKKHRTSYIWALNYQKRMRWLLKSMLMLHSYPVQL